MSEFTQFDPFDLTVRAMCHHHLGQPKEAAACLHIVHERWPKVDPRIYPELQRPPGRGGDADRGKTAAVARRVVASRHTGPSRVMPGTRSKSASLLARWLRP